MVIPDIENVRRKHTAVKQRSKIEEKRKYISVLKIFSADDICGHCRHKQSYCSSDNRNQNGNTVGMNDRHRCFENQFVCGHRPFPGDKTVSAEPYCMLGCERTGDEHEERYKRDDGDNHYKKIAEKVKQKT